jgi:hypothetical protein
MLSIEFTRLFITIGLVVFGGVVFFLLHHHTKPELKTLLKNYAISAEEYQKKCDERRKELEENKARTTEEAEELLIMREQEIHKNAIRSEPIPEMVAIASPIIQAEREKYRAIIEKQYGFCPSGAPLTLSRTPNMMRWELMARVAAAADIGSLFCYLTYPSFPDETQATSYVILRADQPNRWKHFEITHRTIENLSDIVQKHIGGPCSDLILPPTGPIVEFVWKPVSKQWEHTI